MSSERDTHSRIGNLAGALWVRDNSDRSSKESGSTVELARTLDEFCGAVLWSGGSPPPSTRPGRRVSEVEGSPGALRALGSVLAASDCDRVLFVLDLGIEFERLLALVAYPGRDLVAYRRDRGAPATAVLCVRKTVLPVVRQGLSEGKVELESIFGALDTAFLDSPTD